MKRDDNGIGRYYADKRKAADAVWERRQYKCWSWQGLHKLEEAWLRAGYTGD